jgi:hypothetical protein
MHWIWRATTAFVAGWISILALGVLVQASGFINDPVFGAMAFISYYSSVIAVPVAAYGVLTRRYYPKRGSENETRCRQCGYILRGISEPRCPECGERI